MQRATGSVEMVIRAVRTTPTAVVVMAIVISMTAVPTAPLRHASMLSVKKSKYRYYRPSINVICTYRSSDNDTWRCRASEPQKKDGVGVQGDTCCCICGWVNKFEFPVASCNDCTPKCRNKCTPANGGFTEAACPSNCNSGDKVYLRK